MEYEFICRRIAGRFGWHMNCALATGSSYTKNTPTNVMESEPFATLVSVPNTLTAHSPILWLALHFRIDVNIIYILRVRTMCVVWTARCLHWFGSMFRTTWTNRELSAAMQNKKCFGINNATTKWDFCLTQHVERGCTTDAASFIGMDSCSENGLRNIKVPLTLPPQCLCLDVYPVSVWRGISLYCFDSTLNYKFRFVRTIFKFHQFTRTN